MSDDRSDKSAGINCQADLSKVILLCSSRIFREGLKNVIEPFGGYTIISCVDSGAAAQEQAIELGADIVIVLQDDLEIPSFEELRQLKQAVPNIGIAMITSHKEKLYVQAALDAGVDAYALSSVSQEQLHMILNAVSVGATWLDKGVAESVRHSVDQADLSLVAARPMACVSTAANKILSPRECEVIELVVQGLSNREMAEKLVVSVDTIKTHIRNIMHKLGSTHRSDAAFKAITRGLVVIESNIAS